MNEDGIPELIETWKIAKAAGLNTEKMSKLLGDMGLTFQAGKRCSHLVVRREFAAASPTLYGIFAEAYKSGAILSRRGRWSREPKRSEDNQENHRGVANIV